MFSQLAEVEGGFADSLEAEALLKKNLKVISDQRVILFNPKGEVLIATYDLPKDFHGGELLPEILQSNEEEISQVTRYSRWDSKKYTFYGSRLKSEGQVLGYVRVAKGEEEVQKNLWDLYINVVAVCFVLSLGLGIVLWWIAKSLTRPLVQLKDLSDRISKGDFSRKAYVHSMVSGEMHSLGQSMNRMSRPAQSASDSNLQRKNSKGDHLIQLGGGYCFRHQGGKGFRVKSFCAEVVGV